MTTNTQTHAAPEVTPLTGRPPKPSGAACLACGSEAMPGDDLCLAHGGMTDGIERHAAMRAA